MKERKIQIALNPEEYELFWDLAAAARMNRTAYSHALFIQAMQDEKKRARITARSTKTDKVHELRGKLPS